MQRSGQPSEIVLILTKDLSQRPVINQALSYIMADLLEIQVLISGRGKWNRRRSGLIDDLDQVSSTCLSKVQFNT